METSKKNIIKTLCYSDVFDYPLRLSQIHRYLLEVKLDRKKILGEINNISMIGEKNGYYYLLGKEENITKRIDRENLSNEKFEKAKAAAKILSKIPFLKLIGVSGSLSMRNSNYLDDIDLFFIARKNTLWFVRFFVLLLLMISGQKRKKGEKVAKDKICPNMFLSENEMSVDPRKQNLYMAHEVVQLKVLYNKDKTYEKFMHQNKWVENYLPNSRVYLGHFDTKSTNGTLLAGSFLRFVNSFFYTIQVIYMKKSKTTEEIDINKAIFHPIDKGTLIMDYYQMKVDYHTRMSEFQALAQKEGPRILSTSRIN